MDRHPIYRPFQALITLRNVLVHRNAEFLPGGVWPGDLEPFKDDIFHVEGDHDWTTQVMNADTA